MFYRLKGRDVCCFDLLN